MSPAAAKLMQPSFWDAPRPAGADWIDRRLPRADFVSVSDVAAAFNVAANTVLGWIEAGEFQRGGDEPAVINIATKTKPRYRIARPKVIAFFLSRSV